MALKLSLSEQLQIMLEEAGFTEPRISYEIGGYERQCDCGLWEAYAKNQNGTQCVFSSADTMTECARYGIRIVSTKLTGTIFEIYSQKSCKLDSVGVVASVGHIIPSKFMKGLKTYEYNTRTSG